MPKRQKWILLILGLLLLLPNVEFSGTTIKLQRTGCFGFCPAYQVTIYDSGTVIYEGYGNVESSGLRITQIPRSKVYELIAEVHKAHFFGLENEYKEAITDIPTFTISVRMGVTTKTVVRYGCAPQALIDLEYKIDEVANSDRWIGEHSYLRGKRMRCPYYGY